MNMIEIVILSLGGFGVIFGGFVLWVIWPHDEAASPSKPGIKPAE
jgi:hypothetical protein